jgi:soluble lytic murein transglycosylase
VDIWRKARLAVEAGKPKTAKLAVDMVATNQEAGQLSQVFDQPERLLAGTQTSAKKSQKSKAQARPVAVSPQMALLALIRLGQTDVDNAASWLEKSWSGKLDQEQLNWFWGELGKLDAMHLHSSSALTYYGRATGLDHAAAHGPWPEDMLVWRARAALRAGDWSTVLDAIRALSPTTQREATWVYWRARAQLMTVKVEAERAQAWEALRGLASSRGFYEQLALEELGSKISPPPKPEPLSSTEKDSARNNTGLIRALTAIDLGLRAEGVREWNYVTNLHSPGGMNDRELLAAADLACSRQIWDRCINTSDRTRNSFDVDQRYPMPLRDVVLKRAQDVGLDPAYVYGLIRQESRFVGDARSNVGAAGWMQVMPATAKWTAKKLGLNGFDPAQLHDRETNIAIGTAYLKYALDDFQGLQALAAAAYNAGPSRAKSWRHGAALEGAIWAENVPFNETRDYVKKVLANTTVYAALISGQPQSLKARLSTIGPRDEQLPDVVKDLP